MIETGRLRLRPFTPADEGALFEVFSDAYARQFYPQMADRTKVREWIAWNVENYAEFGYGLWAMELKSSDEMIGDCGLTWQDVEGRAELEIGYHVVERERGKGYATEAARACLDFGFRRTGAGLICSIVRPANLASCTVAGRIHASKREILSRGTAAWVFYTSRDDWSRCFGSA